ncbi:hypothetical protein M408DRAFT_333947, partial [Serendipita vermifera MAFF 305830]
MDVMVWFACRMWVRGPVVTCLLWVSGKSFASGFFSKARSLAGVLWASRVEVTKRTRAMLPTKRGQEESRVEN